MKSEMRSLLYGSLKDFLMHCGGLGKEMWKKESTDEYVRKERESWE